MVRATEGLISQQHHWAAMVWAIMLHCYSHQLITKFIPSLWARRDSLYAPCKSLYFSYYYIKDIRYCFFKLPRSSFVIIVCIRNDYHFRILLMISIRQIRDNLAGPYIKKYHLFIFISISYISNWKWCVFSVEKFG